MMPTTIIKLAIMVLGIIATLSFLIPGLMKDDKIKKNRAGILFAVTCVALMIVSIIEFAIYYKPEWAPNFMIPSDKIVYNQNSAGNCPALFFYN